MVAWSHVLSALKRKYAKIVGRPYREEDLAHLVAVILMFNPEEDLGAIRPTRDYPGGRVKWTPLVLQLLRETEHGLSVGQIAPLAMTATGMDANDRTKRRRTSVTLHHTLDRLEARGLVQTGSRDGRPIVWRLAESEREQLTGCPYQP